MRNYWLWTAVLIAAVLALVSILNRASPNALEDNFSVARVIYLLMILAFIGSGFFATQQMRLATAIKQAAAWFAIFAVLVVGYTYRDDFNTIFGQVRGEVAPTIPVAEGNGTIAFTGTTVDTSPLLPVSTMQGFSFLWIPAQATFR